MRIMLVTDAWEPQMNGVVRTLSRTVQECRNMGHDVEVIHPGLGYKTFPLPTYPEIQMAIGARGDIKRRIQEFEPDAIHIATEGSLGQAARALCLKWGWPFSTSYHTKFPEYVTARFPFIPLSWGYWFMRRFHNSGGCMMVATPSMRDDLAKRGFENIIPWARGVDTEMFNPDLRDTKNGVYKGLERPIYVNVGRIAVEKNMEAFLDLDMPGTKVVVGDGPYLQHLKKQYPDVVFTGSKFGKELARHFADADVFIFPSLTDTFGLVNTEAMACGTPVAGFNVAGPKDIIVPGCNAGFIGDDLRESAMKCLDLDRKQVRAYAETWSWERCAEEFLENLMLPPLPERRRFWRRLRRFGGRIRNIRVRLPKRLRRNKDKAE